jgi:hypothetical protein
MRDRRGKEKSWLEILNRVYRAIADGIVVFVAVIIIIEKFDRMCVATN